MKKLDNLGTRPNCKGIKISWGLFLCPACGVEVERQLSNGYRNKTCGCQRHVRDMAVPEEEKRDRLKHQEARQNAALYCPYYYECYTEAGREDKAMNCYSCEKREKVESNCHQGQVGCCGDFNEMTEYKSWA